MSDKPKRFTDKEPEGPQDLPEHDLGGETGKDYEEMGGNEPDRRSIGKEGTPTKPPEKTPKKKTEDESRDYSEDRRPDEMGGLGPGKKRE